MGIAIAIIILILAVIFHEYSHGWMANQLGDDTAERQGRLTLNPIKHIDPMGSILIPIVFFYTTGFIFGWAKPVPFNPANLRNQKWGPALVAVAGPASNVLLAILGTIFFRIFDAGIIDIGNLPIVLQFFHFVVFINVILAVINLIPIPPLDGSKILAAVLPEVGQKLFDFMERLGIMMLFVVFAAFFLLLPVIRIVTESIMRFLIG